MVVYFNCINCEEKILESEIGASIPYSATIPSLLFEPSIYCKKCADLLPELVKTRAKVLRLPVVGLFGSVRFEKEFKQLEKELTFKGYLVLMPYLDGMLNKTSYSTEEWERLMLPAFKRIELATIIYMVDCYKDGTGIHIGDHTQREIDYAKWIGKQVKFYSRDMLIEVK